MRAALLRIQLYLITVDVSTDSRREARVVRVAQPYSRFGSSLVFP